MTRFPNDPPLMWLQDANKDKGIPRLIGCTACTWFQAAPSGKGWIGLEQMFNQHRRDDHNYTPPNYRGRPPTAAADDRCGTYAGARYHYRNGTNLCPPCREAIREYDRAKKERQRAEAQANGTYTPRGGPIGDITDPADPRHGTVAGARAHWVAKHPTCDACLTAKADYQRRNRNRSVAA